MKDVPEDFPRGFAASTIPGTQAKFLARKIGERYIVGPTQEEIYERWDYCEDLAQQLAERTLRKQAAGLISDLETFYKETEQRVRGQGWNVSEDEVQWLMKRTRSLADESQ
ncbi:hypothetical protein [Polaromonas sp. YR568]|uniref:hypothetical protein n=1 Tax=Polaromonas sp. YR568 TaxID=1855301 RepID=UPI0031384A17